MSQVKDSNTICIKCDKNISAGQLKISCSTCALFFHIKCQKISKAKLNVLQEEEGILWFCESCRVVTKNMISHMSNMEKRMVIFEAQLKSTIKELETVQGLCMTLDNKNKQLEKEVVDLKKMVAEDKQQIQFQTELIANLRRDLHKEHTRNISFDQRLDGFDQSRRDTNVRIVGLPENDEVLNSQVVQLLKLPNIMEQDIDTAYRLGKKKEGKFRDVVVKFASKKKRDIFFAKRKDTPKDTNGKKAYINEDLTPFRSKLFYDTRCLVRRKQLHSAWIQGGNIMVKAEEFDTPASISSYQELRRKVHRTLCDNINSDTNSECEGTFEDDFINPSYN